jgi:glycosyltransferase involved in cell wall biosynthesis
MENKLISIVSYCYNEEENVTEIYEQVKVIFAEQLNDYVYEHIFIDNASTDQTVELLKDIAKKDKNLKIIVNARNFGHIRSPMHGLMQARGDVVITLVADLQDPPEMLVDFVRGYEEGYNIVLAVRESSQERGLIYKVRGLYYRLLKKISDTEIYENFNGYGLYDRKTIQALQRIIETDAYPFFRGMISEIGYKVKKIPFHQPIRAKGVTKNNFYTLYDNGILGLINNSKVLLRLSIFIGFIIGFLSIIVGIFYFVKKLMYWDSFSLGLAPMLIGGSLMFSVVLFFIGILGEYTGQIYTQTLNRPLVFEKERINFEE